MVDEVRRERDFARGRLFCRSQVASCRRQDEHNSTRANTPGARFCKPTGRFAKRHSSLQNEPTVCNPMYIHALKRVNA